MDLFLDYPLMSIFFLVITIMIVRGIVKYQKRVLRAPCETCGALPPETAKFCPRCGRRLLS